MNDIYVVIAGDFEGTAFTMGGITYTACHNVIDRNDCILVDIDRNRYLSRVLAKYPTLDIAILATPNRSNIGTHGSIFSQRESDEMVPGEYRIGGDCSVIGHPMGMYWIKTTGILCGTISSSQLDRDHLLYGIRTPLLVSDTAISEGSSGAPLFQNGQIVAMVVGYSVGAEMLSLAVPISKLLTLTEDTPIGIKYECKEGVCRVIASENPQLLPGDIIEAINGQQVALIGDINRIIGEDRNPVYTIRR